MDPTSSQGEGRLVVVIEFRPGGKTTKRAVVFDAIETSADLPWVKAVYVAKTSPLAAANRIRFTIEAVEE